MVKARHGGEVSNFFLTAHDEALDALHAVAIFAVHDDANGGLLELYRTISLRC